jgi:uncharacterized protein (DUF362 family)
MKTVAISKASGSYPSFPFNPSEVYPEYSFSGETSIEENSVYKAVRNNFILLKYDIENIGQSYWNPLKNIVKPGSTVFIKPNLVDHKHRHNGNIWSVITHPSVVRVVADYVVIALKGKGKIIIGDNPHVDTDFSELIKLCFFDELISFYRLKTEIAFEIVDCRFWHMPDLKYYGFKRGRKKLAGDPMGQVIVDIGSRSLFAKKSSLLFRGTYNERYETILNHSFGRHRYFFSESILSADTYISIPKLKTHAKVGVTLNIKGLIGTITNKNCLVHWRIGFPIFGGDEYPAPNKKRDYIKLYWQHFVFSIIPGSIYFNLRNFLNSTKFGFWYNKNIETEAQREKMLRGAFGSNDTTWRMTVDVYNAFVKDVSGYRKNNNNASRFFSVIDGVIGGDVDGPHYPHEKRSNVIISSQDMLISDIVATRFMDLDIFKIQYLNYLICTELKNDLSNVRVLSPDFDTSNFFNETKKYLQFAPPKLWQKIGLHKTFSK